jgi:hypothetical protein
LLPAALVLVSLPILKRYAGTDAALSTAHAPAEVVA